jgi:predicted nucleic acid-binding protein
VKRFVVDASVTLSWFVDGPASPYAERVKEELSAGAHAVVPALWHAEMANGFIVAERRHILTTSDINECLKALEMLLASVIETSSGFTTIHRAIAVARTFRLSAYDGLYLDTAQVEELPLATLDLALRSAAPAAGVELFL